MHTVTLIPGDGIGPEIVTATRRMIEATGAPIEWEEIDCGEQVKEREGTVCPDHVLDLCKKNGIILKGPLIVPKGGGKVYSRWSLQGPREEAQEFPSVNNTLRRLLGCHVGLRLAKSFSGLPCSSQEIEIAVVRELTEDVYVSCEYAINKGHAVALKVITEQASERALRFGFEYAQQNQLKKVTAVHKANVLKLTDGLFLKTAQRVALDYPSIEFEDMMIDAATAMLVLDPSRFHVIVAPNQYGDILSDISSAITGSLGLSPGVSVGEEIQLFEATHGAAPDIAGQNLANPTALMLTGILMLKRLKEEEAAQLCEKALGEVFREGLYLTRDLGGQSSATIFTAAVIEKIESYKEEKEKRANEL